MSLEIDGNQQQDPSEMDAMIPGEYHGRIEQRNGSVTGWDPLHHDVGCGGVDCVVGEWRIPTLRTVIQGEPSPGFCNRDFRNPHTGESIIPTQVYVDLLRDIADASQSYQWKFIFLVLAIQMVVMLGPFMIIDLDDVGSSSYFKIACVAVLVFHGLFMWKTGMQWMNSTLHARMERVVQERQGKFIARGVQLGYSHETTGWYSNRSHLWLRRFPESHRRTITTKGNILESTTAGEQELLPPIFIHLFVPGEIHINEKEYDPSMVMDREVWISNQNTHFGRFKHHNRYLNFLMFGLLLLFCVYTVLIPYFMYAFADFEPFLLRYIGIASGIFLTWYIRDRWVVQKRSKVTFFLIHNENPNFICTMIKFETSTLPFRNCYLSRRYQAKKVSRQNRPRSDIIDGRKVADLDAQADERILV